MVDFLYIDTNNLIKVKEEEIRNGSGCIIVIVGIYFIVYSIGLILTVVSGKSSSEFFINEDGESDIDFYQFQFWVLLVATIIFIGFGGNFKDVRKGIRKILHPGEDDDEGVSNE